jgi:hypothetical protein
MKYPPALVALLLSALLQASIHSASNQPASDANAWGDPVEGVQMRVTIPKDVQKNGAGGAIVCVRAPSFVCGPPRVDLQLRNVGTDTVTFNPLALARLSRIEVDGVWYAPAPLFGSGSVTQDLAPGQESTVVPLAVQNHFFQLDSKGAPSSKRLDLQRGKHSVRVKTYGGSFGVHGSANKVITVVSNLINFETTVIPADGIK